MASYFDSVPGMNALKEGVNKVGNAATDGMKFVGEQASQVPGVNAVADGISSGVSGVTGGLAASFATMTVLKADTKAKIVGMSPLAVTKVGRIIRAMQQSEFHFTDEEVDLVVKALYVTKSDEDLQAAFDMFDARLNGTPAKYLKQENFKDVLPLVGENIPEEKIDELFKEVDADGSGNIEFDEFKTLMLAMNPTDGKGTFGGFTSSIPGADSMAGGFSSFASGLGDNWATMTVLSAQTKAKLVSKSPLTMTKVGRVCRALQASEYHFTNEQVDQVVNALYVTQADEDLQACFDMFDKTLNGEPIGHLTAAKFRVVLPLVGEEMPSEQIDALFAEVDSDGSGNIEFDEFKTLMLKMNPQPQK